MVSNVCPKKKNRTFAVLTKNETKIVSFVRKLMFCILALREIKLVKSVSAAGKLFRTFNCYPVR